MRAMDNSTFTDADMMAVYARLAERWRAENTLAGLLRRAAANILTPSPIFRALTDRGRSEWSFSPSYLGSQEEA